MTETIPATRFDGNGNYLLWSSGLGIQDADTGTFAALLKMAPGSDGQQYRLFCGQTAVGSGSTRFGVFRLADGKIRLQARQGSTTVVEFDSTWTLTEADGWAAIMLSWTAGGHLTTWKDDLSGRKTTKNIAGQITYTVDHWAFAGRTDGQELCPATFAWAIFDMTQIDFDDPLVRSRVVDSRGRYVPQAADGSTLMGAPATLALTKEAPQFHENGGNGPDGAVQGVPLTVSPTSPPVSQPEAPVYRRPANLPDYWRRHHWKVGLNLASGEFGHQNKPGQYGTDYVYPSVADFDWAAQHGCKLVRVPMLAERIWPGWIQGYDMPPLLDSEMERIDGLLDLARERDQTIILDVRNSHRYNGQTTTDEQIAALWTLIAERYEGVRDLVAYGLTNEPSGNAAGWESQSRAAVKAIRKVDRSHVIVCPVTLNALNTPTNHPVAWADDPENRTVYDAHFYGQDNTGFYGDPTDVDEPDKIADRMAIIANWADRNEVPCMVGEFNTPSEPWGPAGWEPVMARACEFIRDRLQTQITGTAWAAGPWWPDSYVLKMSQLGDGSTPNTMQLVSEFSG